jgi:hypothetical protein
VLQIRREGLYWNWAPRGWNGGANEGERKRLAPEPRLGLCQDPETGRKFPRAAKSQVRSLGAFSRSFHSPAIARTFAGTEEGFGRAR